MSTRKRKQDEELVALPSDESEDEEECVQTPFHQPAIAAHRYGLNWYLCSFISHRIASMRIVVDDQAAFCARQRCLSAEEPIESRRRPYYN
jgi:hypothetical protein